MGQSSSVGGPSDAVQWEEGRVTWPKPGSVITQGSQAHRCSEKFQESLQIPGDLSFCKEKV